MKAIEIPNELAVQGLIAAYKLVVYIYSARPISLPGPRDKGETRAI